MRRQQGWRHPCPLKSRHPEHRRPTQQPARRACQRPDRPTGAHKIQRSIRGVVAEVGRPFSFVRSYANRLRGFAHRNARVTLPQACARSHDHVCPAPCGCLCCCCRLPVPSMNHSLSPISRAQTLIVMRASAGMPRQHSGFHSATVPFISVAGVRTPVVGYPSR